MARDDRISGLEFSPWQVAKATLACGYLTVAFFWSMPAWFPLRGPLVEVAGCPFQTLGLWQGWDMFAPDPMPDDIVVSVAAVLDNGELVDADLTNMPALATTERYCFERWRRFCNDHLRLDANAHLWPSAADWFGRVIEQGSGRNVDRVVLWRHWRPVVPPVAAGGPVDRPDWTGVPFYTRMSERP